MEKCCTNDTCHKISTDTPYNDLAPNPEPLDYTYPIFNVQKVSNNYKQ